MFFPLRSFGAIALSCVVVGLSIIVPSGSRFPLAQSPTTSAKRKVLVDRKFRVRGIVQAQLGRWESELQPLYDLENQRVYTFTDPHDDRNNFSFVLTDLQNAVTVYKSNVATNKNKAGVDFDRSRGHHAPFVKLFMIQLHPGRESFSRRIDTCLAFERLGQVRATPIPIGYEETIRVGKLSFTFSVLDYLLDEKWVNCDFQDHRSFGYRWIEVQLRTERSIE